MMIDRARQYKRQWARMFRRARKKANLNQVDLDKMVKRLGLSASVEAMIDPDDPCHLEITSTDMLLSCAQNLNLEGAELQQFVELGMKVYRCYIYSDYLNYLDIMLDNLRTQNAPACVCDQFYNVFAINSHMALVHEAYEEGAVPARLVGDESFYFKYGAMNYLRWVFDPEMQAEAAFEEPSSEKDKKKGAEKKSLLWREGAQNMTYEFLRKHQEKSYQSHPEFKRITAYLLKLPASDESDSFQVFRDIVMDLDFQPRKRHLLDMRHSDVDSLQFSLSDFKPRQDVGSLYIMEYVPIGEPTFSNLRLLEHYMPGNPLYIFDPIDERIETVNGETSLLV